MSDLVGTQIVGFLTHRLKCDSPVCGDTGAGLLACAETILLITWRRLVLVPSAILGPTPACPVLGLPCPASGPLGTVLGLANSCAWVACCCWGLTSSTLMLSELADREEGRLRLLTTGAGCSLGLGWKYTYMLFTLPKILSYFI